MQFALELPIRDVHLTLDVIATADDAREHRFINRRQKKGPAATYQLRVGEIGYRVHSEYDDEAGDGDGGNGRDDHGRVGGEDAAVTERGNKKAPDN